MKKVCLFLKRHLFTFALIALVAKAAGGRVVVSEPNAFRRGLEWAGAGKFDLRPFITGVYPLEEIQRGFESLTGDTTAMKTMIEINGGN